MYAVTGKLKGFDQLLNLVLDEVEEELQGESLSSSDTTNSRINMSVYSEPEEGSRSLGLVVLRGPTITLINPVEGSAEIENPFAEQE